MEWIDPKIAPVAERTVTGIAPQLALASLSSGKALGDEKDKDSAHSRAPRWRWVQLALLSLDICVSYLPYYSFVPILTQSMEVYGVNEDDLNVLCIIYALVYVPCAFLTGPVVGWLGCRWSFILSMGLTSLGCALRCGPGYVAGLLDVASVGSVPSSLGSMTLPLDPMRARTGFGWVVVGQALCALGQPFVVNTTSQVGAQWFPPHERPAAAMVSNLMNFVGSSLSFVLPPLIVSESMASVQETREQISNLLQLHLFFAIFALVLTVIFYRAAPLAAVLTAHRRPTSCLAEVCSILNQRDFWVVNGQFMIYVAVCHAFDAVEGSLLEHYGYSASLTSWTAVACAVAAVGSTIVEAIYITDPASYKAALIVVNVVMMLSFLVGFLCLIFRLHAVGFVLAVGIMGLATPGWGCTFELGSEVCFPAREATVSSLLEAFSNLFGVAGIIVIQRLIDVGLGAGVLLVMGALSVLGGLLLFGLSGRLRRSEAETMLEEEMERQPSSGTESPEKVPSPVDGRLRKAPSTSEVNPNRVIGWLAALSP